MSIRLCSSPAPRGPPLKPYCSEANTGTSIALICRKMYFWAGPELYHEMGECDIRQRVANMRYESDEKAYSRMKNLATATHVSSSLRYTAQAVFAVSFCVSQTCHSSAKLTSPRNVDLKLRGLR